MTGPKQDNLSPAVHTAIGGLAGIVEVCIMQPTVSIKNALQEGRPLPANPAAYYRGLLVLILHLHCVDHLLATSGQVLLYDTSKQIGFVGAHICQWRRSSRC